MSSWFFVLPSTRPVRVYAAVVISAMLQRGQTPPITVISISGTKEFFIHLPNLGLSLPYKRGTNEYSHQALNISSIMRFSTALILTGLFAAVNAHFQLQFPPPRGVFVEDQEPDFCDGYDSVASNRTSFPLTGGIISLDSEHPQWTAAVFITNASNPTSFDNFTQITSFFQETIEGSFCMSFDLSQTNATGLTNGENVTIQILYDGGDGNLFQAMR
ncbi:hypothetical protein C8R41DRAFT_310545 [Lentinula lateritia]|uniref:Copper acquisition factor BIM1-like domain-containing protein n=1 Tax=Lentinula lateritia TaxID=40482 RepID=A0ABQ8VH66_9AGAR|nr:hypothetical protein C8R41DRAFT_310545 [Lentinula lateritia]